MTTLNTIIEEEKKEFEQEFAHCKPANEHTTGYIDSRDYRDIETFLTSAIQRAYEAGIDEERERIEAIFKESVPPHAMDLEDSVWLKRLLNKAFGHENIY
jgi:hypothetical protein